MPRESRTWTLGSRSIFIWERHCREKRTSSLGLQNLCPNSTPLVIQQEHPSFHLHTNRYTSTVDRAGMVLAWGTFSQLDLPRPYKHTVRANTYYNIMKSHLTVWLYYSHVILNTSDVVYNSQTQIVYKQVREITGGRNMSETLWPAQGPTTNNSSRDSCAQSTAIKQYCQHFVQCLPLAPPPISLIGPTLTQASTWPTSSTEQTEAEMTAALGHSDARLIAKYPSRQK